MTKRIHIGQRVIGGDEPVYVVAEMSANHLQRFDLAVETLEAAKKAGADAIKLQTYTADTITIDSRKQPFMITGTIWDGENLHDLYKRASTPWEWQPKLKAVASDLGLDFFSSPFDPSSVDFLEGIEVPVYKIASAEIVDIPLIERVARTGKPLIISTGMATLAEVDEAVAAARRAGTGGIALLKCTSAYPAPVEGMNLRTIPHLEEAFDVPVGLSDHTLGISIPAAAVALGACIVEKHFTLSRSMGGPDAAFSLEPAEFGEMVRSVRDVRLAVGTVRYGATEAEAPSLAFGRSLYVVEDMREGDLFTPRNVRSIRPAGGLHTRYLSDVLTKRAAIGIERGTPLTWALVRAK